jgi:hypothetical protein
MKRQTSFVLLLAIGGVFAPGMSNAGQAAAQTQQRAVDAAPAGANAQAAPAASQDPSPQSKPDQADGQAGEPQPPAAGDAKLTSVSGSKALGMSILGNQEAPKSLVIVPWKTSELGGSPGVSLLLDDSRQPVDRDVFMRALRYHEIRSEETHPAGATAGSRQNAAAESGAAQSTAARRR